MTKRLFALTLSLVLIFSSFAVFAETEKVDELDRKELKVELENMLKDMEEVLEEVDEVIEKQENLNNDGLEDAIEEVLDSNVQNFSTQSYSTNTLKPEGLVKKQIMLKKEFVDNSVQAAKLTKNIKNNILEINRELRNIIKSVDRNMSKSDYIKIAKLTKELKDEIEEIDYVIGSIGAESKAYVNFVVNKRYMSAMKSFERIVSLQEEQIALLTVLNTNTYELKVILKNV